MAQERVYSPNQAAIGAFIGGPLVSVMFIKRNFKVLGNTSGESKTLVYGVIIILVLLGILPFLPKSFPNMLIPLLTIIITRTIVEKYQVKKQDITSSGSLTFQSNWRVFWVSLACMALSLLVIGAAMFGISVFSAGSASTQLSQPATIGAPDGIAPKIKQLTEVTKLRAELDQRIGSTHHGQPYPLFTTGSDGEFAWYVNDCLEKIAANGIGGNPVTGRVKPGSKITFSLTILPEGTIKSIKIFRNECGAYLNNMLRNAITRAAPFQRFPSAMARKHNELVITHSIMYK